MSIVAEALNAALETEMGSVGNQITSVSRKIDELSSEIKKYMDTKYSRLLRNNSSSQTWLMTETVEISENVDELKIRFNEKIRPNYAEATEELSRIGSSLEEARLMHDLTRTLLHIDQEFDLAFKNQNSRSYLEAAQRIVNLVDLLDIDKLGFLDIFNALLRKATAARARFSSEATIMWKAEVSWVICQLDLSRKTSSLKVQQSKDELEKLLRTLDVFEESDEEVDKFSQSLMNEMIIPCIERQMSVTTSVRNDKFVLSMVNQSESRPSIPEALAKLTSIFEFLQQRLDLSINEEKKFIELVGIRVGDRFLSHLLDHCLSEAIPSSTDYFSSFEIIVSKVQQFNATLKQMSFINSDNNRLDDYCRKVEEVYVENTIDRYILSAKQICSMNLQDMTLISSELPSDQNRSTFTLSDSSDNIVFPRCNVSKSAIELIALVKDILNSVVAANPPLPNFPLKLFCTARDCINLYVENTPIVHSELLESLPQHAALFYNNCFYIAHQLLTVNEPYKAKYNDQIMKIVNTFVDMVSYVKNSGLKILNGQVSSHLDTIHDLMSKSGLSNLMDGQAPASMETSVLQCVENLNFLETMWRNILPTQEYNKIMGQLCDSFLDSIISQLCSQNDIQETTATQIVELLKLVLESIPCLFDEPKEVHRLVKKWLKFNELIHILKGSLVEIGDRWADGKGPLALEYSAEQVRRLIMALFQTSKRRAAILSKIK